MFCYFTGSISHFSLIIILNKICFYLFRSSHWEIFYKIAALNQCQTNGICLCKCSIHIKVANYRPQLFFKDFDHTVSLLLCKIVTLKNIYFCRILSSMAASVQSWNSNDQYILFSPIERFECNC